MWFQFVVDRIVFPVYIIVIIVIIVITVKVFAVAWIVIAVLSKFVLPKVIRILIFVTAAKTVEVFEVGLVQVVIIVVRSVDICLMTAYFFIG